MTSLIYNPYTIEHDDCEDCCVQFPIVSVCPDLFPDGIAQYWEFVIPDQTTQSDENACNRYGNPTYREWCLNCYCDPFAGIWQLDVLGYRWFGSLTNGCYRTGQCDFAAVSRNLVDRLSITCPTLVTGGLYNWTFNGWRMCLSGQANLNFTPTIPVDSIILGGYITSGSIGGSSRWGVAWWISLDSFNPLGPNTLNRSVSILGGTLNCHHLPETITVEPTI